MAFSKEIVLYHYKFSPYARRIVWYLDLRKIPYSQCLQPPIMPRPDVKAIGVEYRRIPLMSIGRDIYCDTRIILTKLEELFPASAAHPSISASTLDDKTVEKLLGFWIIDGGIFLRASQLIPTSLPLMQDPKFKKDRAEMTGRNNSNEALEAIRPEALMEIKSAFKVLEEILLADGREWILKSKGPSLADIEAVWPFHWLKGLKGALPADQISAQQFPKTYAWIERYARAVSAASEAQGKPKALKGPEAAAQIGSSEYAEPEGSVDANDPSGLQKGQKVTLWPIDSGFKNKDHGKLVALTVSEIVIESKTQEGKAVRVHMPRHGFSIRASREEPTSML